MHLEISISIVEYTCEDYMFAQLIVLWLYLSTTLKVNAEVAQSLEETSIAIKRKHKNDRPKKFRSFKLKNF